jgi:flavin-binding protein dodecin
MMQAWRIFHKGASFQPKRIYVYPQSRARGNLGPITFTEVTTMAEKVYKVIELVGTSTESWEKAASAAVMRASKTLRDLRVAEVKELDLVITDGKVEAYRARLNVSFKYEDK